MRNGPGWSLVLAVLLYAGWASRAQGLACNIPEPGNCYSEGVIVDCGLCDSEPVPPLPDPRPAAASDPPPAEGCALVQHGIDFRMVCGSSSGKESSPAKEDPGAGEKNISQGEAFLRTATTDALGATVKLSEGDTVTASTILLHADEMALRARKSGLPAELDLTYLRKGGAKNLSHRFDKESGISAEALAARLASSTLSPSGPLPSSLVKGFVPLRPEGDSSGPSRDQARHEQSLPKAPSPAAMTYSRARAFFEQAGNDFAVSTAVPVFPSLPRRSVSASSFEANRQELAELRSMIRSASLRRLGREPAAEDLSLSLFERVSRRIRILATELD